MRAQGKTEARSSSTKPADGSGRTVPASRESSADAGRRYRPLGLVLAIFAAFLIYGLGPLIPLFLRLLINLRGGTMGLDLNGIVDWEAIAFAAAIFVLCFLAWLGRPRWSRWGLIVVVWLATVVQFIATLQSLSPQATNSGVVGGDFQSLTRPLQICELLYLVLIPLYLTWYMNRAPARAFYRAEPQNVSDR